MSRTGDNDQLLLQSFREGEEQAFDKLFRMYSTSLTYFAYHLIHHSADAEDIVQDAFVSLWKRRKKLSHIESIKSYLYTSIRYQCIKYLQKKNKYSSIESVATTEPTVEKLIIAAEIATELYQLIDTLSPRLREVIRLYYLEGKSYREIGELLRIDPETVRQHRFRALLALRKTIIPIS